MFTAAEEFQEVLGTEMYVDMEKLREMASEGVPDEVRGEVWKYLLGVNRPDKSEEESTMKLQNEEYSEIGYYHNDRHGENPHSNANPETMKRVVGELKRYSPDNIFFQDVEIRAMMERVIGTYLSHLNHVDYSPGLINICAVLVYALRQQEESEAEVYYMFSNLMSMLKMRFTAEGTNRILTNFMTYFRALMPDLYNHFEEEELEPNEWALNWLHYLLSRSLPLDCVVRLWDTYFSLSEEDFDFHLFVCLAVLNVFKEELEELEYSELKGFMQRLPLLDMDQIIAQAHNIQQEMISQNLL